MPATFYVIRDQTRVLMIIVVDNTKIEVELSPKQARFLANLLTGRRAERAERKPAEKGEEVSIK